MVCTPGRRCCKEGRGTRPLEFVCEGVSGGIDFECPFRPVWSSVCPPQFPVLGWGLNYLLSLRDGATYR